MSLIRNLSIVCSLVLAGHVALADTGPTKADFDKFLAFIDKVVDTAVADQDNCPKMGTDVNAIIDANKDLLAMANKARASGGKMPADVVQHMMDSAKRMAPAAQKCGKDSTVKAALARLPHGPPPQHN